MTIRTVQILLTCLLSASFSIAQGTYVQIDYPGAQITTCWGINAEGDITGNYAFPGNGAWHGFILRQGVFESVELPGFISTTLAGINSVGQAVGESLNSDNRYAGFIYDVGTHTFTPIAYPGAQSTAPSAIDDSGEVIGRFDDGGNSRGFELIGSTYSQILPPTADWTELFGITNSGEVVGIANSSALGLFNFIYTQGKYGHVLLPNVSSAGVGGISPSGTTLVGYYMPSSNLQSGFQYKDNTFLGLLPPNATGASASGVNDSGRVVGTFTDMNGLTHGFLWIPPVHQLATSLEQRSGPD